MSQMSTKSNTLLTPAEVAALAKVSRETIYREVMRGALPAFHVGRQLRIEQAAFTTYLQAGGR